MLRQFIFAAALLAISACAPTLTTAGVESTEEDVTHADRALAGLSVAQARCAGCHAITPRQISPNSDAPPFASIARRPGLTNATASRWLRNSHDFPDQMNFTLEPDQA
jgi:mono/diheme cytochrome c family protein